MAKVADKEAIEAVVQGQKVYALSKTTGWCVGTVTTVVDDSSSPSKKKASVQLTTGEIVTVPTVTSSIHTLIEGSYDANDADLFKVGDLHVATLLFCLKDRYEKLQRQYSKMGEMILSVNPFQVMPFNGPAERDKYLSAPATDQLPPHVWHIADKAYKQIVVRGLGNQSVVISGESGSGKTENTKALVGYLSQLSHRHSSNAVQKELADRVSERLHLSNPILESFGNARTVRNDNSSRFGKYTKLFFDTQSGVMVGGEMVTYLLEKSRIITCAEGERCYHVYYELLAGLPPAKKAELQLKTVKDYPGLNAGKTHTRRGADGKDVNDAEEFGVLCNAMTKMGIDANRQDAIWRTLAAILHLSEVTFGPDENDKAKVLNRAPLDFACKLLGINPVELIPCFLEKSKTKIMTTLCTVNEAYSLRDAFSKALYIGTFDYLVGVINAAIAPEDAAAAKDKYIGVLDIFGFENFKRNSFEQLCINFANEGLANHYNRYTFLNDEAECHAEGIAVPPIVFPDNAATLDLLEHDKTGIFPLLDEECGFKGGTSGRYTTQCWENWGKHPAFITPKATTPDCFGIHHYASDVLYNTDLWLEKNGDALKTEARDCLRKSSDPSGLIKTLFEGMEVVNSDGTKAKRVTVALRFRLQLASLRSELEATESHFVRCIKPNMRAEPRVIDNDQVGSQLESAGVLQTIALKRQGYPIRRAHRDFAAFFLPVAPRKSLPIWKSKDYATFSKHILDFYLRLYGWKAPHFAVGKTKIFCKPLVWTKLERLLLRKNRERMKKVVPYLKGWIKRFRARKAEEERRRQEQQRLLQEQAAQRAAMGSTNNGAMARQSGLPEEKVKWFEEFALVFVTFDLPVLLDVCYNLDTRDKVLQVLTDMQKQRIDETLPGTLKRIFTEAGLRDSVADHLIANGIVTLKKLGELNEAALRAHGLNDQEIKGIQRRMLRQQSEKMVNERLQQSIGTSSLDALLQGIRMEAVKAFDPQKGNNDVKLVKLLNMGFERPAAAQALQQANGDVEVAVSILTGGPIPQQSRTSSSGTGSGQPPAPQSRTSSGPSGGAPPAGGGVAPPPNTRPPPPQTRPAAPPSTQPQPAYNQYPTQPAQQQGYGSGGGSSPQQNTNNSRPAASPAVASNAVPNPQAVAQLVNMGFQQADAMRALMKTNNNVEAALNHLLQSA